MGENTPLVEDMDVEQLQERLAEIEKKNKSLKHQLGTTILKGESTVLAVQADRMLHDTLLGRISLTSLERSIEQLKNVSAYVTGLLVFGWVQHVASISADPDRVHVSAMGASLLFLLLWGLMDGILKHHIKARFGTEDPAMVAEAITAMNYGGKGKPDV